ncbi:hypothetical protein FQR65_LT15180 [Abscondita terminalis]|nr:hypothetical protein FQR65_LT15180 [Abscondita terminalis]
MRNWHFPKAIDLAEGGKAPVTVINVVRGFFFLTEATIRKALATGADDAIVIMQKQSFDLISPDAELSTIMEPDQTGTTVTAISIGDVSHSELEKPGQFGASKVLNVQNGDLKNFVNQAYASVIAEAAHKEGSKIVVRPIHSAEKVLHRVLRPKLQAGLATAVIELPQISRSRQRPQKKPANEMPTPQKNHQQSLSDEQLEAALEKAIADEQYEDAAAIRDERVTYRKSSS